MNNDKDNFEENVFFLLDETTLDTNNDDIINDLLHNFDYTNKINNLTRDEINESLSIEYKINYNVKDLLLICEYYGIAKELKVHKFCKEMIIYFLVDFENDPLNNTIVLKRKELWNCINLLKNDKFMKKYIIW